MHYDGYTYTGELRQDKRHGKGEEERANGRKEIAYWADGKKEGAAKYIDENGVEEDIFYKDDEIVYNNFC